jgi:NADH:ubiquinone oxidoreductase subunit 6 (subunit J)
MTGLSIRDILFIAFAVLTVLPACIVVFHRKLVYSAFSLMASFFGVAALYALVGADFLAAVQVLIYVGGVVVLILFGVMLTSKVQDVHVSNESRNKWPAAVLSGALFLFLLKVAFSVDEWTQTTAPAWDPTTQTIGHLFLNEFLLPFEVASVVLLLAIVGASFLVRKEVRP